MLNNILNGWRPAITKILIGVGFLTLLLISGYSLLAVYLHDSKWECTSTEVIGNGLTQNGEQVVASGVVGDQLLVMTLWADMNGREWTVVVTNPKNTETSCIVLYGTKFKSQYYKTII